MIFMSNIKPNQKEYKNLSKLKFYTLTNFPFIEADFDAITNYELMCKIVEYLNGVIENEQNVSYNVRQLYDAFMELQAQIDDEIEAQNQRIDDYFEDTNLQIYVDNKIDEMIESNQFQTLLIEAINEINPNILKFSNKVQSINFDSPFYATGAPFHILQQYVLDSTNKALLINAIKETLIEQEGTQFPTFHFINPWDLKVIRYSAEISYHNNIADTLIIVPIFDFNSQPIGANQEYTGYAKFNILYTNDEITDLTFNEEYSQHYRQVDIGNTQSFVPTLPYEPATKDYVDSHSSSGTSLPIYYYEMKDWGTVMSCSQYGGISFAGTDWDDFKDILNQMHSDERTDALLEVKSNQGSTELFTLHLNSFSSTDTLTGVTLRQYFNSENYKNILIYGNNNRGMNYQTLQFMVRLSDGVVTTFAYSISNLMGNSTFVEAENVIPVDISSSVTLGSDVTAQSVEGVQFIKQGNLFNMHGTIGAINGGSFSAMSLTIPADYAPIPFTSGVGYSSCYGTCILLKASDSSYHTLLLHYVHAADAVAGGIAFSPINGEIIEAGDVIAFNISYIRTPQ